MILRPENPATEIDRAEGWRYLSRLTRVALEMMLEHADADFPTFYSASHATAKIGADNPDNLYFNATIAGDRPYRLRGTRGTVPFLSFGTKANRYATDGTMVSTGELDALLVSKVGQPIHLSDPPRQLSSVPKGGISGVEWARDNSHLLVSTPSKPVAGLWRVSLGGGQPELHQRQQRMPAGQVLRVLAVLGGQVAGLLGRACPLVGEH